MCVCVSYKGLTQDLHSSRTFLNQLIHNNPAFCGSLLHFSFGLPIWYLHHGALTYYLSLYLYVLAQLYYNHLWE